MKVFNILMLIGWSINLGFGILALATGGTINPVVYICACLICILRYAETLIWGDDN
jgi:hypothetical protein